jgi:hypothetical protein
MPSLSIANNITEPTRFATSVDSGAGPVEPAFASSRTAVSILLCGLLIHFFLFLRVAVLYAPYLSYQGPSGADRVFYYAYVRSIVIDRDLEFDNDLALHPPTSGLVKVNGKQINKKPIGAPLLALPLYAFTHLAVLTLDRLGISSLASDGFSTPYVMSYISSQMFCALLGIWLLYRTLLRFVVPQFSALAVLGAYFSTNAVRFSSIDLMMPHAAAQFSIAWCSFEAVRLRERPTAISQWFRLGVSLALVIMVRYQNAVFALVPAAAALLALKPALTAGSRLRLLGCAASGLCGLALAFFPQLLVWRLTFGSWIANSYGTEPTLNMFAPHILQVLTDPPISGLSVWLPALCVGIVGCFGLAAVRNDWVAFASGLAWLVHLYVISCWHAWQTLIERCPFDFVFPISIGFAYFLLISRRRAYRAALIAMSMLIAWNLPLAVSRPTLAFPFGWPEGFKTLTGISAVAKVWSEGPQSPNAAKPGSQELTLN